MPSLGKVNISSTQKQPSCKNGAALNSLGEKSYEIKGGSQEMAAISWLQ